MAIISYLGVDYGGTAVVEITEEAYAALSEEQKKDGTLYLRPEADNFIAIMDEISNIKDRLEALENAGFAKIAVSEEQIVVSGDSN